MISQVEIYSAFTIHSLQRLGSRPVTEGNAGYRKPPYRKNYQSTTVKLYGVKPIFAGSSGIK